MIVKTIFEKMYPTLIMHTHYAINLFKQLVHSTVSHSALSPLNLIIKVTKIKWCNNIFLGISDINFENTFFTVHRN